MSGWPQSPAIIAGQVLAQVAYNPSGNNTYTTASTALVAVDAVNLAPTFTAPPSGRVWVEGDCTINCSPAGDITFLGFLIGGAPVGPEIYETPVLAAQRLPFSGLITGLAPGVAYTVQLAWAVSVGTGTASIFYGAGTSHYGPVNIRVVAG